MRGETLREKLLTGCLAREVVVAIASVVPYQFLIDLQQLIGLLILDGRLPDKKGK